MPIYLLSTKKHLIVCFLDKSDILLDRPLKHSTCTGHVFLQEEHFVTNCEILFLYIAKLSPSSNFHWVGGWIGYILIFIQPPNHPPTQVYKSSNLQVKILIDLGVGFKDSTGKHKLILTNYLKWYIPYTEVWQKNKLTNNHNY